MAPKMSANYELIQLQIFFFLFGHLDIKGGFLLDEADKIVHLSSTLCVSVGVGGCGGSGRGGYSEGSDT